MSSAPYLFLLSFFSAPWWRWPEPAPWSDSLFLKGVGGVIFLDRNTESSEQIRALTGALQNAAVQQGPRLPLLIGWNHEGGTVARREAGLTHFPSAMALGAAGRPDLVYAIGRSMAVEMQSLGVNVNYAPVLDVNVEPTNPVIGLRSFGNEPTLVANFGSRFISGQQEAGVIVVAKHFPDHGGVVMTDDMGMRAIRDHYSLADAAVLAVLAGNDLLLAVETDRDPDVMRHALLNAVADGRIYATIWAGRPPILS